MENYLDVLAAFIIMFGLVAVVFIIAKYTYLVKKAMIEKGFVEKVKPNRTQYIDIACILGGLGIGLLISTLYTTLDLSEDSTDLLVWGTILLTGAIGLIAAHFLRRQAGDDK